MKTPVKAALAVGALSIAMVAGFTIGQAQGYQPRMQNALGDLRAARSELQAAARNKGGHRERAIDLVDQAIGEVRAGMDVAGDR
jgi:hypothetical protein